MKTRGQLSGVHSAVWQQTVSASESSVLSAVSTLPVFMLLMTFLGCLGRQSHPCEGTCQAAVGGPGTHAAGSWGLGTVEGSGRLLSKARDDPSSKALPTPSGGLRDLHNRCAQTAEGLRCAASSALRQGAVSVYRRQLREVMLGASVAMVSDRRCPTHLNRWEKHQAKGPQILSQAPS